MTDESEPDETAPDADGSSPPTETPHFPPPLLPDTAIRTKRRSVWPLVAVAAIVGPAAVAAAARTFETGRDNAAKQRESADCATERRSVEVAVEAFTAEHGEPPRSSSELGEYFRTPPTRYVVTNGQVYPGSDSPCEDDSELMSIETSSDPPKYGECVAIDERVVDFLWLGGDSGNFKGLEQVPCTEVHQAEVVLFEDDFFAEWSEPPDAFALGRDVQPWCVDALENYSGELYEDSAYDAIPFTAADDRAWNDDRSLTCLGFVLEPSTGEPLDSTTSMAGQADLPERGRVIGLNFTKPGDCLTVDADLIGAGYLWARHAECDEPHNAEVVANETARFRGSQQAPVLVGDLEVECASHFEGYSGQPFEDRTVDLVVQAPSEESWALGMRGLICVAVHLNADLTDLEPVTGSIRGDTAALPEPPLRLTNTGPVGQCYRMGDVYFSTQLWWVTPIGRPVDCDEAHDAQVIAHEPAYFDLDTPPHEADLERAVDFCIEAFESYTGEPHTDTSPRGVFAQPATAFDWETGDRSVTCIAATRNLRTGDVIETTGSMQHG